MVDVTTHFTLEELEFSQLASRQGIDNIPDANEVMQLATLCRLVLEPARALLGVPLHVDSGFRSPAINNLVGGAPDSAHLDGRAADVIPIGLELRAAFATLKASDIPFDQLIIECNEWLHLSIAKPGVEPRHQTLAATGKPGRWTYVPA
jgi:zinc D-Ala-D-Ala carboxypeptidase